MCDGVVQKEQLLSRPAVSSDENSLLAVLNGLRLFLSRKPGVNHQLVFLVLFAARSHGCGLTSTFVHPLGVLHWSVARNLWPASLASNLAIRQALSSCLERDGPRARSFIC